MTTKISASANQATISVGSQPVANLPSTCGIAFCKNKLLNGEVTRINQRGVANWAAVANGNYGYDRWKKIDASNMTQIIEAGNFRPSTVHTLSGQNVTTQQITSPASGNWTLPNIPITATNVQLEEGAEATPFEIRPISFELAQCQRYYSSNYSYIYTTDSVAPLIGFKTSMRTVPTLGGGAAGFSAAVLTTEGFQATQTTSNFQTITATAEL